MQFISRSEITNVFLNDYLCKGSIHENYTIEKGATWEVTPLYRTKRTVSDSLIETLSRPAYIFLCHGHNEASVSTLRGEVTSGEL